MRKIELEREYDIFKKNLPEWLVSHSGEYVLIKERVIDFYPDRTEALTEGITRFGKNTPFLVKKIEPERTNIYVTAIN